MGNAVPQGPIAPDDPQGLRAAVAGAAPGAVVELLPGRHVGGLELSRPVTLRAVSETEETALVGAGRGSVVAIEGRELAVRLEGLTLTGGGGASGGGVSLGGYVRLTLERCRLVGNRTQTNGGALAAGWGEVVLRHCLVEGNESHLGAGLLLADAVVAEIEDCTFLGNVATVGAAAAVSGASRVRFVRCRFTDNRARERAEEPWGGDVLFSAGTERARPTVALVECALDGAGRPRVLWARPGLPGGVSVQGSRVPRGVEAVPGVAVAADCEWVE